MTCPTTTMLLDGENLFRGKVSYPIHYTCALFDRLLFAIEEADGTVESLRCYGKAEDRAIKQLRRRIPTRPQWVLVLVAQGADVADDALCFDLQLMSHFSSKTTFVVGSSDNKVLRGAEKAKNRGSQIRVVLKGRHVDDRCHIRKHSGLVDDHVHICDLLATSIKSSKQAAGKANVRTPVAHFADFDDLNRAVSQLQPNAVSPALTEWTAPLRAAGSYPELFDARMKLCDEIYAVPVDDQTQMWGALDAEWVLNRRRLLEAEAFSGDSAHAS
jgi:hypothetical protein